jgi:cell division protein FtsN
MRIDYSGPKKSCSQIPQINRPRKEPVTTSLIASVLIAFLVGFGVGWYFSQRAAKKSFQAAMEQTSLESSGKAPRPVAQPPQAAQQQPPLPSPGQQQQQSPAPSESQTTPEPPLSFYKTLPGGQKSTVIGSGINAKEDPKVKQPLQAAVPANMTRLPPQQPAANPRQGGDKPAGAAEKSVKTDAGGFTVQVSSFSLKSEAEALKNRLAAKGYNVFIVESDQGDRGIWYRVRVGRRLEQDAAKELAARLGKGAMAIPDKE